MSLNYALIFNKPFRSVFAFRTIRKHTWLALFSCLLLPALKNIEIGGDIDEGLAVYHNLGCVIAPHKAGKNLSVGQGVTIGRGERPDNNGRFSPIIGDNVRICTNAVVFGPITIGDNVIIGAGAIVNKSIPNNCIVVGNPARIINKR